METYEMFSLPEDHWTWIAVNDLPWPHQGHAYMACCGRCGQLRDKLRATYEGAWHDAMAHHIEVRGLTVLPDQPGDRR